MTLTFTSRARVAALALAVIASMLTRPGLCRETGSPPRPVRALADHLDRPIAAKADVSSTDAIVTAFAESISAPAGGSIDRARLDSLFVPGGRIVIGVDPKAGRPADVALVSPDEYAARFDAAMRQSSGKKGGFYDRVIANTTERFGIMAHVYSSYGSRENPTDPQPYRRGVKSFELLSSGDRWYIVEVFYDFERPSMPIPAKYLARTSG